MVINLHGRLGQKYGRKHFFKVRNAKEAIDALCGNFSTFRSDLIRLSQKGVFYKAIKGKTPCMDVVDYYDKCDEIDIIPSIFGSGAAGLIIAGTAALTAGSFVQGLSFLVYIGIALIIQGISQLLFPFEFSSTEQDAPIETQSFLFNNTDNNAVQGFRIPIIYGQIRGGSNVISTNIEAFDLSRNS